MSGRSAPANKLVGAEEGEVFPLLDRLAQFLISQRELLGYFYGLTFAGMNLKKVENGWFLVVKAVRPDGERVVSFHAGPTDWETWLAYAHAFKHRLLVWKPDRYE